jgi:hypothetical protein
MSFSSPDHRRRPVRAGRSGWGYIGIILAVLLAISGLVFIGVMVLVIVGLNQWGNNK